MHHPCVRAAARLLFFGGVAGFAIAGAYNDARDYWQSVQQQQPMRQCAVVSVTRPARCLR